MILVFNRLMSTILDMNKYAAASINFGIKARSDSIKYENNSIR
ncbi:hypothetical protein NHE_0544 [Neorickettsia helminthoeca str. Oregon]|uniref:Uncharacterized protein n=1 Tax=Neorickettsia helminthoeca str. Oregon TaxID=1286528 RepID=X5HKA7_9RICK|nr:hypothetical protein NHE_0544 [Neorickettsia helminthoeca str. Oregon]